MVYKPEFCMEVQDCCHHYIIIRGNRKYELHQKRP